MNKYSDRSKLYFTEETGKTAIGRIRAYFDANADVIGELEKIFYDARVNSFPETANRYYLEYHFGGQYPPKEAKQAVGEVVFFGDVGTVVPKGTELSANGIKYKTTAEGLVKKDEFSATATVSGDKVSLPPRPSFPSCYALVDGIKTLVVSNAAGITFTSTQILDESQVTLSATKTDGIPLIADEPGAEGNKDFNEQLKTLEVIEGLTNNASVLFLTQGRDEEDTEEYRERILTKKINPQSVLNASVLKETIMGAVPTLKDVWIKDLTVAGGPPKIEIYAINPSYLLPVLDRQSIQSALEEILPIGYLMQYFTILAPTVIEQVVKIKDILPNNSGFKDSVIGNIENLFYTSDFFEKPVPQVKLSRVIDATTLNQQATEDFTLVAGWADAAEGTIYKLGRVDFEIS